MKINIWKLLLAALVVPAAMGACTDERNNFMVDDSVSFVDSDGDWQEFKTLPVYDEAYRFPVVKNGKGLSGATIYIETPDSVIDSYNKLNGTDFVALPAECYDFSTNELRFSKKEIRKFVDLTWNMDAISALDQTKNYVIPVLLTVAGDALPTSEDRDRMLIYPKFAFASMAQIATATSKGDLVYNGEIALDVPVTSENVEIGYEIDNSLIAAYNEKNGTDYKAAPAGLLALDAAASTISAGESSTNFSLRLSSSKLLEDISVLDEKYLIPVRMTSISDAARIGDESVSYVTVAQGTVKGPWTLLEGENNCYAKDPNDGAAWTQKYTADKLFDGSSEADHEWISMFKTQIEFPMTFVVDMGAAHIFTNFIISDYSTHQGNYRDYELYIAEEYDGANTKWTLVAKGKRDFKWTGKPTDYDFPVQTLSAGRYLKFQIMKAEYDMTKGDYQFGCGKLGDVYGEGL